MEAANKKRRFSELSEDELKHLIKKKKRELKELRRVNAELKRTSTFLELIKEILEEHKDIEIVKWLKGWKVLNLHIDTCGNDFWEMSILSNSGRQILNYSYESDSSSLIFTAENDTPYEWKLDDSQKFGTAAIAEETKNALGLPNIALPVFVSLVKIIISFVASKYQVNLEPIFHVEG